MVINIALALIFLCSLFFLWYKVSLKIPELVAIPDAVITERFYEDSAKLRLFVLHIKTYYREGKHKLVFWKFVGKTLYKLHLFTLRFDNGLVSVLKNIRSRGIALNGRDNTDSDYWKKVQEANTYELAPKTRIINEVRKRK